VFRSAREESVCRARARSESGRDARRGAPGKFAGENSDAQRDDDKCRSRQNDHGQSDQYHAESNRGDEKSPQCRKAVESEAGDPFLNQRFILDRALSRDELCQSLFEMRRHVSGDQRVFAFILHRKDMADAMKFRDEI
jgi:hypothetical protein